MKLTLRQILLTEQVLTKFIEYPLPTMTAWKLLKISKLVSQEADIFRDIRNTKIKEYGHINDNTGEYEISEKDEKYKLFVDDMEKLIEETTDISITKINISDIDIPEIKLNLNELNAIEWMINVD